MTSLILCCCLASAAAADAPSSRPAAVASPEMMTQYTLRLVDEACARWQSGYEVRKTPEQIAARQKELREKFIGALGGFPERTPLNARTVGVIQRKGYRVEKVIFESRPRHYVTASLYVPEDGSTAPRPGVLVPCGHAANAKAWKEYQSMGALLALNGMVALVFDPIDQGERQQLPETKLWGTDAHYCVGIGSILLGRNTATFEVWDGMRGIDYLQSRPEVDPRRIGCTGNSGGGTQTSYLMALDERIVAAAPSCYLHTLARQVQKAYGDSEQNIFGQMAFGMEHADYMTMRAPDLRVLVLAATGDFFDIRATWESFRYAKRLYSRLGFSERVAIFENDAGHNYNEMQRAAAVQWMARWLLGRDAPVAEPAIEVIAEAELLCTPQGNVMRLPDARTTYDVNEDDAKAMADRRARMWKEKPREELLASVRRLAAIRPLADLPVPQVDPAATPGDSQADEQRAVLGPEPGIALPVRLRMPGAAPSGFVVIAHDKGGADPEADRLAKAALASGKAVLLADVRGVGLTAPPGDWACVSPKYKVAYSAYLLARSLPGMRAEDLLVCARYARQRVPGVPLELVAVGEVGVPALHAAALEPDLFASVTLIRTLASWDQVLRERPPAVDHMANVVHGALTVYDLPDLAATLGNRLKTE